MTYPDLFSNSAFENGVFYNISESASLRPKVFRPLVPRLSSTLKNGALLAILSEFPLIHFLFAFALINCWLFSWSQGTGINAISLRSWRFRRTFMANRQKAKSMLREEWWESEWERNRLPASLGGFHSTKNSGNSGFGREWNRHFPEFHSEILGVPHEVGLKFRKIGITGKFRSIRPFLLGPSFSEAGNRIQHGWSSSF